MSAPLTNFQKQLLSRLSDRAFNRMAAIARGRGEPFPAPASSPGGEDTGEGGPPPSASALRKKFRHEQVAIACNRLGLQCCSQDDYGAVKAHFLHLLGEDGRALQAHVHAASNGRRQIEWKITQTLGRLGKGMSYAEGICRRMYHGTSLMDASDKQLWKLFYALEYQLKRTTLAA